MTAFDGANVLLPQTAMIRSIVPIATDVGAVQCSVDRSLLATARLTRLPRDIKPSSVVVQSSKGGTATQLPTNNQSF